MNGLANMLLRAGPARLFAALGIVAVVGALLFTLVFRIGGEERALLFSGIEMREAGEITSQLDTAQIPYDLRGDGTSIYVPRSQVLSARLMLSERGLPSRGSVGYEIFDNPDALGQTQFQQNINRLRALEGELARTIASIQGVASARVHLVLPERRLFASESEAPSASIVIALRRDPLTPGQVRAVRNLVASATPGLTANRVTILDETGRLLAAATSGDGETASDEEIDSRQAAMEQRIRSTVTDIVEGVVGAGNSRVQVSLDMDFNRVTETATRFDPEGRVVRSSSSSENTAAGSSSAGAASSSANVPDGASASGGAGGSNSSQTQETTNYEISNTRRVEVSEGGRVRRLSVAVAVDGVTAPATGGGQPRWTARSAQDLQQITALVRSAVGFNETRGDRVEVVSMRFARPEAAGAEAAAPGMFDFGTLDIMRIIEIVAALVAALAVTFFVLGPLVSGLVNGGGRAAIAAGAGGGTALLGGPPTAGALPGPDGEAQDAGLDVARIQGRVTASSSKRVAEVVSQHPDESIQIIRSWLNNAL